MWRRFKLFIFQRISPTIFHSFQTRLLIFFLVISSHSLIRTILYSIYINLCAFNPLKNANKFLLLTENQIRWKQTFVLLLSNSLPTSGDAKQKNLKFLWNDLN